MTTDSQPAFSIVPSVFRTAADLAETIESVVAQTFADRESILVDNGMSDEEVRIVGKNSDDLRIELTWQQNNGQEIPSTAQAWPRSGERLLGSKK